MLGYIFEKYINQKQMGAYYTKEDITGYISSRTVLPALFRGLEQLAQDEPGAVDFAWDLLRADPDRYIPGDLRHGCELELPQEIALGEDNLAARSTWNLPASTEFALPTEIWREVVARRNRYLDLKRDVEAGHIRSCTALVTANLDIEQWALDVIEEAPSPELVEWIYRELNELTVLDPTCGSGAFLFAALNILEPLYEASLDRMQAFATDADSEGPWSSSRACSTASLTIRIVGSSS